MPKTDYPGELNKRNLPKLMLVKRHKTPPKEETEPVLENLQISQRKQRAAEKLSKVQHGITVQ